MSHAMVRCLECDLVYVDQPPSQEELSAAYHDAGYDSAIEAEDAARTYAQAIEPVLSRLSGRLTSALEIGTGTGAFLEELAKAGASELVGVEPSKAALLAAPAHRRNWIREGIFDHRDFEPQSFDLICCFMTLEHVREPGQLVKAAKKLLRPGGAFVSVTHDYRALINRFLGRRSPIIDIEHMQLFSAKSAQALFTHNGYHEVGGCSFRNSYRPSYWLRLMPLPQSIKSPLTELMSGSVMDTHHLAINVGNRMTWAFAPRSDNAAAY